MNYIVIKYLIKQNRKEINLERYFSVTYWKNKFFLLKMKKICKIEPYKFLKVDFRRNLREMRPIYVCLASDENYVSLATVAITSIFESILIVLRFIYIY